MKEHALQGLLSEFRRRRVFRAVVGYGIGAFALLQIIEPIMHGLRWPDAVLSYVVVALALGFPLVVILAWVFDVNAGRIERTATDLPASDPVGLRGVRLAVLLVGMGVLAAVPGLGWYFFLHGGGRTVQPPGGEPSGAAERKTIAVLPFTNMSSDKADEYFSDGMTEELINALANIDGLHVSSRTSVFALKGKNLDARQIGDKLNVRTLLEGSVRREGNTLRVTAQLINVGDDFHLWSKTFDRELKSVFALEEEIARSIAQTLRAKLVGGESAPLVKPSTTILEAHELYLKGRYFMGKRNAEALRKAAGYFDEAIQKDPAYALAYVGLADSTTLQHEYDPGHPLGLLPKAKRAAQRALEIDAGMAEAHASLALISQYEFEWESAEKELRRAIELKARISDGAPMARTDSRIHGPNP